MNLTMIAHVRGSSLRITSDFQAHVMRKELPRPSEHFRSLAPLLTPHFLPNQANFLSRQEIFLSTFF